METHSDQRIYPCAVLLCCLYQKAFWDKHSVSDQASMYVYSLVSGFCSSHFSVKQLKFDMSFCVNILITVFFGVLKIKRNLVKLTFRTAISSHQVMGMSLTKCGLWKIYHTEYGLFLATDWLKTKGSGRVMG